MVITTNYNMQFNAKDYELNDVVKLIWSITRNFMSTMILLKIKIQFGNVKY